MLEPYPRPRTQNKFLLIVMDQYSRFVLLKPLRNATTAKLIDFLEKEVFCMFSAPKSIFSDNSCQFRAKSFKDFLTKYGVHHIMTPKHLPQSNASERVNQSILASIRAYIDSDHKA